MDSVDTYRSFAKYYDSYVQGFGDDIPLYLSLCDPGDSILEIGCGTGRVLKPLLDTGHEVTGVDISVEMLEIAEKKLKHHVDSGGVRLLHHNFIHSPLPKRYDMVLVTFYTFNYLLESQEQESFLANVYETVRPGGRIIMDLFRPLVLSDPSQSCRQEERHCFIEGKKIKLNDIRKMSGLMEERIQTFTRDESVEEVKTYRRYVDKRTAVLLLSEANFVEIQVADSYDHRDFHAYAPGEAENTGFIITALRQGDK